MTTYNETSILRLSQIIDNKKQGITPIIPISRTTFLNGVKAGIYPKGFKLGVKSMAWNYGELMQALNTLKVAA
jgi:prophage regulatory protein